MLSSTPRSTRSRCSVGTGRAVRGTRCSLTAPSNSVLPMASPFTRATVSGSTAGTGLNSGAGGAAGAPGGAGAAAGTARALAGARRGGCRGRLGGSGRRRRRFLAADGNCRQRTQAEKSRHEHRSFSGSYSSSGLSFGLVVFGAAGGEIVEVHRCGRVLAVVVEGVVDTVVGLRADRTLRAALFRPFVLILLLALGRRVGAEVPATGTRSGRAGRASAVTGRRTDAEHHRHRHTADADHQRRGGRRTDGDRRPEDGSRAAAPPSPRADDRGSSDC